MPPAPPTPRSNPKLATIAGIEIQFHLSWFIILILIALSLGTYFRVADPAWDEFVVLTAALVTTILFFVSVVVHELAHALVARRRGVPVRVITLFVFGGVSELTREPDRASDEFLIAVAGPVISLVLGGACWGLSRLGNIHQPACAVLFWLGEINLILAIFNLVPGFPLDGGRLLRALIWNATGDLRRATLWATRGGKFCALAFIVYGVVEFFRGSGLGGLWLAFIGWFLFTAAEQSWRQIEVRSALRHYTVRDLETPFFSQVQPEMPLEEFIHEMAETHNYRASLVMDADGALIGIITPADLGRVPRPQWAALRVRDLMIPRAQMATVEPQDGLDAALEKMAVHNVGQIPILAEGRVRGVIRRDRIIELLHQGAPS